jgi:hypothetical protein
MIVSDNGTEFTSNAIRMRDELLTESLFFDLDHAPG